jgi:hypothetical protein
MGAIPSLEQFADPAHKASLSLLAEHLARLLQIAADRDVSGNGRPIAASALRSCTSSIAVDKDLAV